MARLAQCAECGDDFISTRASHRYCSKACSQVGYSPRESRKPMTETQQAVMRSSWGYEGRPLAGTY